MKNIYLKVMSLALVLVLAFSATSLLASAKETEKDIVFQNDTFIKYRDGDGYRYIGPIGDMNVDDEGAGAIISDADDYYDAHNKRNKDIAQTGANTLPESVDLSKSKYFPPIGNQGGLGSCASFAGVYYQFSYHVNEKMGVAATYENSRSPQIAYNFVSSGSNSGTTYFGNFGFLRYFGAPAISTVPYTDSDSLNWYATDGIWREAIRTRLDQYYKYDDVGEEDTMITSPDDEDLLAYKTALSDGKLLGFSTFIYSWKSVKLKQNVQAPENAKFVDEEVISVCDGSSGAHSMTIVGYNDNIWTDINNNDRVDAGEMGAFKIANSWGDGYCNDGFVWVAYDALNKISCVEGADYTARVPIFTSLRSITVRDYNDLSDIYIQYTLNTAKRTQHEVYITGEKDGTISKYKMFYGTGGAYTSQANEGAFDGTANACDGVFVCPLDNIVDGVQYDDFENYTWTIEFVDTNQDGNSLIVKDARIVNEVTGKTYVVEENVPASLDGSSVTYNLKDTTKSNKVVYYVGYDNPVLNYKVGDSQWQAVKMEENLERIGHTHKFVFEDTEDDVTLYFSDEQGNVDDNDGKYYLASDRLNFYRTEGVREKITITDVGYAGEVPDVIERFNFKVDMHGGYAPYKEQYTVENLDTGEIRYILYDQMGDKSFAFYSGGRYKITAQVMDQTGDEAVFEKIIDVIDFPFEFSEFEPLSDVIFVGESTDFHVVTKRESIISLGPRKSLYTFDIKDKDGNIIYTETLKSYKMHLDERSSKVLFSYIPEKAGDYTMTVSSTDLRNDYAEGTIEFTVFDKTYGDSNADGRVSVVDATNIQQHVASIITVEGVGHELADCDTNDIINVMDATYVQRYLAQLSDTAKVGDVVEYIPIVKPTEPTQPPTEPETQPSTVKNIVTFTNSFSWSNTIYCYYWSNENTNMVSWPGVAMTHAGVNDFNEVMYTFEVPKEATYIIFSNGSKQTTDISYSGGEVRYYPVADLDSNGKNLVKTW